MKLIRDRVLEVGRCAALMNGEAGWVIEGWLKSKRIFGSFLMSREDTFALVPLRNQNPFVGAGVSTALLVESRWWV